MVPTDESGRVTAFIEKPPIGQAPTNLINAGIYVLDPSVLDCIPEGRRVSIERETFPAIAEAGQLYGMASATAWIDIGTPASYIDANFELSGGGQRDAVMGEGVRIDARACVSEAVLLDGAVVARDAVVRRSIVGRRAVIGEGAVVDDLSVIGDGAVVAPGARLVGARLPEDP